MGGRALVAAIVDTWGTETLIVDLRRREMDQACAQERLAALIMADYPADSQRAAKAALAASTEEVSAVEGFMVAVAGAEIRTR